MPFKRVLVANRGEVAVRVIRALHELGIEAVAVYSTADRGALHTRLADRAICVGPPAAAESYLNVASLVGAAETTGCDAVHPGWGFLAESAAFVRACEENDLVFVGPSAETMERMGDKARAKTELARADVPRRRVHERGHLRVPPRPRRRLLLHRAERAPPGRAPGKRTPHGHRHRARTAPDRGGGAARAHPPRAAARPCDRRPDQRPGPGERLRARPPGRRTV